MARRLGDRQVHGGTANDRHGPTGVRRGKKTITTVSDPKAPCPLDKVNREFRVSRPNALWVVDFTYAHTWAGFVYVTFVIDAYARRIVGWKISTSATADFMLDALDQAIHARRPRPDDELIHHSDRGVQQLHRRIGCGNGNPALGQLVQPPSPLRTHRAHLTCRSRSQLLCSQRDPR